MPQQAKEFWTEFNCEQLINSQQVKKFPAIYVPQRFIRATMLQDPTTWPSSESAESSRIWGSHGGEYEDGCLLGCSAV
jgi:hypothetical protein